MAVSAVERNKAGKGGVGGGREGQKGFIEKVAFEQRS